MSKTKALHVRLESVHFFNVHCKITTTTKLKVLSRTWAQDGEFFLLFLALNGLTKWCSWKFVHIVQVERE